mgnify:CR=1 FL=1
MSQMLKELYQIEVGQTAFLQVKDKNILKDLKKDHTIIMITHKPELMKKADRIIVLNEGKIVGDGTHKQLLESNEYYRALQTRKSASKLGVFNND